MTLKLHAEARLEYLETLKFLKAESPRAARQFQTEFRNVVDMIVRMTRIGRVIGSHGVRRSLFRRCAYGVFYIEEGGEILILAVANLRRRPKYWEDRLGDSV